jgi:hypothetical protein
MTDSLISQFSSRRFSISSHLGLPDISDAPSAWFPRLRESQTLLVSFSLLDYHDLGGNHYYPVYSADEIQAHNLAFPDKNGRRMLLLKFLHYRTMLLALRLSCIESVDV